VLLLLIQGRLADPTLVDAAHYKNIRMMTTGPGVRGENNKHLLCSLILQVSVVVLFMASTGLRVIPKQMSH